MRTATMATVGRTIYPYLYVLPALCFFLVFLVYPYLFAIDLSLHSWTGLTALSNWSWVGLANYVNMLSDPYLGLVLKNTAIYGAGVTLVQNVLAFVLAFGLFQLTAGRMAGVLRTLFFYPAIISQVMVGLAWADILRRDGFLNTILGVILGQPVTLSWFGDPNLALWAIMAVAVWQGAGWTMVLYLAGLSGVSRDVLDAAAMDGAGSLALLRHVMLGILRPVISLAILFNVIGNFQTFALIYATTQGGPLHATDVIGTYAYWLAFDLNGPQDMGYAATLSVLMTTLLFAYTILRVRAAGTLR